MQTTDNVGIQYGLKALLAGKISPEEFVTLNETIGGTDPDSRLTAARSTADLAALDIAYKAGIVGNGKNFGKVAIIDSRGYDEVSGKSRRASSASTSTGAAMPIALAWTPGRRATGTR